MKIETLGDATEGHWAVLTEEVGIVVEFQCWNCDKSSEETFVRMLPERGVYRAECPHCEATNVYIRE